MNNIIEIEHLSKSFGEVKAVQDLSFRVKEGELFAFLGINGAGKSTTISIMCGQLAKNTGVSLVVMAGSAVVLWAFDTLADQGVQLLLKLGG